MVRVVVTALAALLIVTGCSAVPTPHPPISSAISPVSAVTPTWSDDFTGAAGARPSAARWTSDTGGSGWGNSELELYTTSPSNASLDGAGHLAIIARKTTASASCWYGNCLYSSARITTAKTFAFTYGRVEARIQVPKGSGLWPAFWMLGTGPSAAPWPASGEIDVMENLGREPATIHGSLHGPGYSGATSLTKSYSLKNGAAFSDGFHIFAVDWRPSSVTFSVDGVVYEKRTPADVPGKQWVFTHPFHLLLNLAVGGTWPGGPKSSTAFPATMLVDYVRVYQRGLPPG